MIENPSFEDFTECPNALGTFNVNVQHWSTPTRGTTDYFNTCSKVMGAPENFNGVQYPKFGNAYAGIYFFAPADYREYIQVPLKKMLNKGQNYKLNFFISLAEGSDFAVKDFGVLFSHESLTISTKKNITKGQLYRIKGNKYHSIEINHPEFHQDKSKWLKIEVQFEAKGFEKHLTLGNLRDNATTRKVKTKRRESKKGAYYYIDMVTLISEDDETGETEKLTVDTTYVLKNVHFEFDASSLDEEAKTELSQIAAYMREHKDLNIVIHGHTDSQGTSKYNQDLSKNRAKAIASYLNILGLNNTRISWYGHGSSKPVAENTSEEGRRQNRRAEFKLTTTRE